MADVPVNATADVSSGAENVQETQNTSTTQAAVPITDGQGNYVNPEHAAIMSDEELDAADAAEEAAEAERQKQATLTLKKKLKAKVNGREVEQEIDLNDDKYLTDLFQKAMGADEKFQKASKIEKQMHDFVKLMQSDPIAALRELGHDVDTVAESYMKKRIEEMQKSPAQLEMEKMQKELEKEMNLRKKYEEEKMQAEQSRIEAEYARNIQDEISTGLQGSTLPKSPYVVKRIAEFLMVGLENGKNLAVKDVVPLVEKQIRGEIQQMFEVLPADVIEAMLGENVVKQMRKHRLSKMKKPVDSVTNLQNTGTSEIKKNQEPKKEVVQGAKDFFRNLGK